MENIVRSQRLATHLDLFASNSNENTIEPSAAVKNIQQAAGKTVPGYLVSNTSKSASHGATPITAMMKAASQRKGTTPHQGGATRARKSRPAWIVPATATTIVTITMIKNQRGVEKKPMRSRGSAPVGSSSSRR